MTGERRPAPAGRGAAAPARPRAQVPMAALVDWRLPVAGADAVRLARRLGAEGIQLDLGGPGRGPVLDAPGRLSRVRRSAQENGVELLGVAANTLNDIGITAPEGSADAARVRAVVVRLLDAAHALGAPLVFVPSFRRSAIGGARDLARTGEVLRRAAGEAQARGLLLAGENVLGPAEAVQLAQEVGSPAFRLLLDTYNPHSHGVDVPGLIGRVTAAGVPFADQIHVKDGITGTGRTPLLGAGDGRVGAALDAVRRHLPLPRALVLENDYRDGDETRLDADLRRARMYADTLTRREPS